MAYVAAASAGQLGDDRGAVDPHLLPGDEAKQAMVDAARWLLTGALAELDRRESNSVPAPNPEP